MVRLTRVEDRLREIREENRREEERRLAEVKGALPQWQDLEDRQIKNGLALARYVLEGKDIGPVKEEGQAINDEKARLLEGAGYPVDYLDPIYSCEICKDTGADGSKVCICKRRMLISDHYSMCGIEDLLAYQNFDSFDLDLFRDDKKPGETLSPRQMIDLYLSQAKDYCKNFASLEEKNLYFYGPVGTGKTYMSNAIAKNLLDQGYTVLYQTASKLLNFIADYNFSNQDNKKALQDKHDLLVGADLLIVDDLGTEISSSVTSSNLFELINERLIQSKATIISSNLDINGIREAYDDRIYSRIVGNYKLVNFFGDDLRTNKFR